MKAVDILEIEGQYQDERLLSEAYETDNPNRSIFSTSPSIPLPSYTIISTVAARAIGYDLSRADARVDNVDPLSCALPEDYGRDVIIGLNFLRHFKLSLDFGQSVLILDRFK